MKKFKIDDPVKNANGLRHHNKSFNLIELIVSPNSPCGKKRTVKLLHAKTTKVSKICDDIKSLISNSKPSLSQVLLSLNIYRKAGSSEIMTDWHRLGHGLTYTEAKFTGDKWVQWSEKIQLSAKNIREGV